MLSSRESSQLRDWSPVSSVSSPALTGRFFITSATWEAQGLGWGVSKHGLPLPHTHRVRCFFLSRFAQCPKSSRRDRTKWYRSASKDGLLVKIWAFGTNYKLKWGFSGGSDSKESAWNPGDVIFPGLGRSPGGGLGNPLQRLAWRIPWAEEPGGLQSTGLQSQTWLGD